MKGGGDGGGEEDGVDVKREGSGPTVKVYMAVWAALLVLTALTVTTAGLELGGAGIIFVLAIASVKSTLVLLYFMHLRWERSLLIRLLMPISLVLLAVFIGLTYTDILYR